jgi:protocatechuate 3,4-dioxygenase beta subunit
VRAAYAPYRPSALRHLTKDLHHANAEGVEFWVPGFGYRDIDRLVADVTI